MPVSRNRKKKNNRSNNPKPDQPRCIKELFKLHLNDCRKCEGTRDEFSFYELPEEEQRHWDKSGMIGSIDFFLYCPICDEYSAILDIDEI